MLLPAFSLDPVWIYVGVIAPSLNVLANSGAPLSELKHLEYVVIDASLNIISDFPKRSGMEIQHSGLIVAHQPLAASSSLCQSFLSLKALVSYLDNSFRVLTAGGKHTVPRHKTAKLNNYEVKFGSCNRIFGLHINSFLRRLLSEPHHDVAFVNQVTLERLEDRYHFTVKIFLPVGFLIEVHAVLLKLNLLKG
jgi:hypothetical protein